MLRRGPKSPAKAPAPCPNFEALHLQARSRRPTDPSQVPKKQKITSSDTVDYQEPVWESHLNASERSREETREGGNALTDADARTLLPRNWDEVKTLQTAINASVVHYVRITLQPPQMPSIWRSYDMQWLALQTQLRDWFSKQGVNGGAKLVRLEKWTGGICSTNLHLLRRKTHIDEFGPHPFVPKVETPHTLTWLERHEVLDVAAELMEDSKRKAVGDEAMQRHSNDVSMQISKDDDDCIEVCHPYEYVYYLFTDGFATFNFIGKTPNDWPYWCKYSAARDFRKQPHVQNRLRQIDPEDASYEANLQGIVVENAETLDVTPTFNTRPRDNASTIGNFKLPRIPSPSRRVRLSTACLPTITWEEAERANKAWTSQGCPSLRSLKAWSPYHTSTDHHKLQNLTLMMLGRHLDGGFFTARGETDLEKMEQKRIEQEKEKKEYTDKELASFFGA